MLYFAGHSPLPTLTPAQKAPGRRRPLYSFVPFFRGLVGSFTRSFINSLVHSIHSPHLHPGFASARTTPRALAGPTPHPASVPPRPAPPPFWTNRSLNTGRGQGLGGASLHTTPGGARGSGNAPRGCGAQPAAGGSVRFLPRRACRGRSRAAQPRAARRLPFGWGERAGHGRMCAEQCRVC